MYLHAFVRACCPYSRAVPNAEPTLVVSICMGLPIVSAISALNSGFRKIDENQTLRGLRVGFVKRCSGLLNLGWANLVRETPHECGLERESVEKQSAGQADGGGGHESPRRASFRDEREARFDPRSNRDWAMGRHLSGTPFEVDFRVPACQGHFAPGDDRWSKSR
jgi:hypothetical protein